MAYQGLLAVDGQVPASLLEVKGSELIGSRVKAPNSVYESVWVVPMDGVSATKVSSLFFVSDGVRERQDANMGLRENREQL